MERNVRKENQSARWTISPATIFINHDIELNKDTDEIREYKKIEEDDYVISPERTYSHSDTED